MPTLAPPPLDSALQQQDGKASPPWARWLQQLQTLLKGVAPSWQTPTLAAGVSNLGGTDEPAGYYKDAGGVVHIRGTVVRATVGTIFTLPAGYRTTQEANFACTVSTGGTVQWANLRIAAATGDVKILTNAPSTWGSIRCAFEADA